MADGYKYTVAQCAVPEERRGALQQFRDKRRLWLSWLDEDEHAIWQTVHAMVWTDVAFKVLTGLAEDDDNALNNPLIVEALLNGHVATQVLAIRRLMDRRGTGIISLRRLVTDVGNNFDLFTRENFVCFDGLPDDYATIRQTRMERLFQDNKGKPIFMWHSTEGPEADGASELAHEEFDRLAGIDPAKRTPSDRLPRRLLKTISQWLVESDADQLAEWSHVYLAHGGDRVARDAKAELKVTANKIAGAIKVLARTTEATARLLYAGGRSNALMPTAQFDQFAKLEPVMRSPDAQDAADLRWRQLSDEWDRCLDGVEDDLLGQQTPS
jgi:hypothetical protein